jgi:hypothetical protein
MRTYQKHTARPMMSSLPRLSLPFPCQARSREKTFPATLWRFADKSLILLGVALELRKFSRYFPAGQGKIRDARTTAWHCSEPRKDVLAKCHGGDVTRKRKLLEKQEGGQEADAANSAKVEIPQSAFIAALKMGDG